MDAHQLQRDLGRLEGKVEALTERIAAREVLQDVRHAENTGKMDTLIRYQERQRGSVRVILLVATTIASAVGGLFTWALSLFRHG